MYTGICRGSNIKFNIGFLPCAIIEATVFQTRFHLRFDQFGPTDLLYTFQAQSSTSMCCQVVSKPIQGVFYTRVGLGDAICLPLLVKRRRRRRPVPPWSWLRDWNETALCACNRHDAPTRCRSAFSNRFPQFFCGENKPLHDDMGRLARG